VADQLLREFDLADAAEKRLKAYSGGMRRRLEPGARLVGRPQRSSSTSRPRALDPISRQAMWERVSRLRDAGVTVLLTTQYLEEADALETGSGSLRQVRLRIEGTADELKRRHRRRRADNRVRPDLEERAAMLLGGRAKGAAELPLRFGDGRCRQCRERSRPSRRSGIEPLSVALARPTLDDVFRRVAAVISIEQSEPQEGGRMNAIATQFPDTAMLPASPSFVTQVGILLARLLRQLVVSQRPNINLP